MSLLYTANPSRADEWRAGVAKCDPGLRFSVGLDPDDLPAVEYLLAWEFDGTLLARLPRLRAIFSTGAGVEQFALDQIPPQVKVVRMLDPVIREGIVEYATLGVLLLHRDLLTYQGDRKFRRWAPLRVRRAADRGVGVMGLGDLGRATLERLAPFGFPRFGWSRSLQAIEGVNCSAGRDALPAFLARCDILVCLLPLTSSTQGILDRRLFAMLPTGAGLVNAARGGHLNEGDLLDALSSRQLSGAVLDVFEAEPPSTRHPFWDHPQIVMTPHVAGMTAPESAAAAVVANIRRDRAGQAMVGEVDRALGY